ncbi:MAG: cupin [Archangiaceae bacterium]|nr:cupin [Archangiaceae bacterium]
MLERLLGPISAADFFARHFARQPLLVRGAGGWAAELATVETCERLISEPRIDVMYAREGSPYRGERGDLELARRLFAEGYTWVMRDVDRADPGLAELGRGLASDVHGTLHLQLYRTPEARFGFGWHFDPEEVFYVQAVGRKRMKLRANTQHPAPLQQAMPTRLKAEAEPAPIVEHLLEPGDVLYIPNGWWHAADALEATVSISAGVLAPSVLDAASLVFSELAADPRWRRRLAPMGRANPLSEDERRAEWKREVDALSTELQQRLTAEELTTQLFAATGWWKQR